MHYITNQNDQIVAADKALLELTGAQSVEELYQKVIKEELSFASLSPDDLIISFGDNEEKQYTFHLKSSPLSSMLGELTLNVLTSSGLSQAPENENVSLADEISPIEREEEPAAFTETQKRSKNEDMISIPDEDFFKEPEEEISITEEPEVAEEPSAFEPISILEEEEVKTSSLEPPAPVEEEKAEISVSEPALEAEKSETPIYIDIDRVSETIGITPDEYNSFLNEFIDTAISLEKDLKSDDEKTQSSAVQILVHLSEVLHLPELSNAAQAIDEATAQERDTLVESFFSKVGRITTQQSTLSEAGEQERLSIEPEINFEEEMIVAPEMEIAEKTEEALPEKSFGTIDLGDVKPIYFDFRLEEAADELSLPVELIEEFVHDFIDQARTETDNMLEAYKQGDLKKIQKTAHLMKGASSNLRINPLADTLYEIQFCEDSSKLEGLIKNYWAHFIAFAKQMELTSK